MRPALIAIIMVLAARAFAADLEPRVDEYLEPYIATGNFQGVVLIARGNHVLVEKGYGKANLEHSVPNTPDTVFQIASVSKPFTATAVMLLADEGKLDIDAPLHEVIPEYRHAARLTVHHLLAHTSGIPNINTYDEYGEIQLRSQTPESLFAYFRDRPLEFEPGRRYSYSNSNYNLLALIIERASGQTFGDFLAERVLAPAGTAVAAHVGDSTDIVANRAHGYAPDGLFGMRRAPWLDWSAKTGNGSMISTASDLLLWTRAYFGDDIVSRHGRERMLTEHTANVGYGWFIRPRNDRRQYHINGRSPGFSSYLGFYPDDDVTIVVLNNLYNSITTSVGSDLGAILFGKPYDMPTITTRPLTTDVAQGIPGRFRYGPDFYNPNVVVRVELRDGHVHRLWDDGEFESALIPLGHDRFIDRAFWSDVELARDADGTVVEVRFDGFSATRID